MSDDPRERITEDRRPWGRFRRYADNEACTVKIIEIAPGERLSLQRHHHRDELWVVLDDTLEVEIDGTAVRAAAGDEFYVPRGATHRIAAHGAAGRVLEIAFGTFREDDIERLEDDYDRVP